jgi:hypothetical protein
MQKPAARDKNSQLRANTLKNQNLALPGQSKHHTAAMTTPFGALLEFALKSTLFFL